MKLDIDITEKNSSEIIKVMEAYPYGNLEIKFERIFWVSEYTEPRNPRPDYPAAPPERRGMSAQRPRNALEDASNRFQRASDRLGAMMGP